MVVLVCIILFWFFFFNQKTAYEMRISDWSSDVCSSDLVGSARGAAAVDGRSPRIEVDQHPAARQPVRALTQLDIADHGDQPPVEVVNGDIALCDFIALGHRDTARGVEPVDRAAERLGGQECVSTCRSRWSRYH